MAKATAKRRKAVSISAYKRLFSSEEGRIVLKDLMRAHYALNSTYDSDPTLVAFREGERNVVLRILSLMRVDTEQMLKEIEEIEKEDQQDKQES